MKPTLHLYQDTRNPKKDGTFPIKVAVYDPVTQVKKLYKTDFSLSPEDFAKAMEIRPKGNFKDLKKELNDALEELREKVEATVPFTFEALNRNLAKRQRVESHNIITHLEARQEELMGQNRMKSALMFQSTISAIKRFRKAQEHRKPDVLLFNEIDKNWLDEFEAFMTEKEGKSISTVGAYLRNVRTIFNTLKNENPGLVAHYPFRKGKYTIPTTKKANRALNKAQIKSLFEYQTKNAGEDLAKDFWCMSYLANGLNLKDLLRLRHRDMENDRFSFFREKTKLTNRENRRPIVVALNDHMKIFLAKYAGESNKPNDFVLRFLSAEMTEKELYDKQHQLIRRIRRNLKTIGKNLDFPSGFSYQYARHSYSSRTLQTGGGIEMISMGLGHASFDTTKAYLSSIDNGALLKNVEKLLNFDE